MSDKIPIVTTANERYFPGLIALFNSYQQYCYDDFDFYALIQGSDDFIRQVKSFGIKVISNPKIPADNFPCTNNRPKETAEIHFYRIIIPMLFSGHTKSIYIDSDSIILQSLKNIAAIEFKQPVGATESNASLNREISGGGEKHGLISSFLVFNHDEWHRQNIFAACLDAMNNPPVEFYTGDQAVLNWVLKDNWYKFPPEIQPHAGHGTLYRNPLESAYILHFLGTNPWEDIPSHLKPYPPHKIKARELWQQYYKV